MVNKWSDDAATETYMEVRVIIRKTVMKWKKLHGGDYEELLSRAHLHYMMAYRSYDPSRSPFTRHIWFTIWHGLLSDRRREIKWYRQLTPFSVLDGQADGNAFANSLPDKTRFDLNKTMITTSNDAETILRLVADPPMDLENHYGKTSHGEILRYLIRSGWTAQRVLAAWREARESLLT